MYVIQQNIPAELKIDFEKIFTKPYKGRYEPFFQPRKDRQDVRVCSSHIYTFKIQKKKV
jgi:hypothetical protein